MPVSARSSSTQSRAVSLLAQKAQRWRQAPAQQEAPKGDERALYLDVPPFEEWCRFIEINLKLGGFVSFAPENWNAEQRQVNAARTGRDLILKARQQGVSTLELARDLWTALKYPGTHTLAIVHDDDTARKFDAVWHLMMQTLARHGRLPPTETDRVGEVVFSGTGSTLRVTVAGATERTAEKKGRGGAIRRLHCSEVGFWGAASTTLDAARGAVPDGGEVVLESTANGAAGAFYDEFKAARASSDSEYAWHFLPWFAHEEYRREPGPDFDPTPRDEHERAMRGLGVDDAQIAWWRAKLAEGGDVEKLLGNFPYSADVAFRASGGQYIDAATCDWLEKQTREPLERLEVHGVTVLIYERPRMDEEYILAADVSEGDGNDAHAGDVSAGSTGLTVATLHSTSVEPGAFGHALAVVGNRYRNALIAPERNNHGHTVIRVLEHEVGYPRIYEHEDGKLGWLTSTATRPPLFDEQADAWRARTMPTPDRGTAAEARTLTRVGGKPQARGKGSKNGARDDRYVARAIGTQVRQRIGFTVATAGRGYESLAKRQTAALDEEPVQRGRGAIRQWG